MGWLLVKKHPDVIEAGNKLNYDDLLSDWTVMFQKRLDPWFALFMCFVFPGLVCTLWGDNFWNGYWVAGALRYIYVLHVTWCVNSAAHLYGDHPYDVNLWPAENPLVSLGELNTNTLIFISIYLSIYLFLTLVLLMHRNQLFCDRYFSLSVVLIYTSNDDANMK